MSEKLRRLAILYDLVCKGAQKHGYVGHTLLQKAVYLLQAGQGLDLGYNYRLYHYGPYCSDLWRDLNSLDDSGLIRVEGERSGYGYRITPVNPDADSPFGCLQAEEAAAVDDLLELMGDKHVRQLESIATTEYVYLAKLKATGHPPSVEEVTEGVLQIKPHLGAADVVAAHDLLKGHRLLPLTKDVPPLD